MNLETNDNFPGVGWMVHDADRERQRELERDAAEFAVAHTPTRIPCEADRDIYEALKRAHGLIGYFLHRIPGDVYLTSGQLADIDDGIFPPWDTHDLEGVTLFRAITPEATT